MDGADVDDATLMGTRIALRFALGLAERRGAWAKATSVWPDDDAYQAKTDRDIPVVVLEPVGS